MKGEKEYIYIFHELCTRSIGETLFTAGINEREREREGEMRWRSGRVERTETKASNQRE